MTENMDTFQVKGNLPIRLEGTTIYTVTEGEVDVYLVQMHGNTPGRRLFAVHVQEYGLLFGIPTNALPGNILMAYGCGNAILKRIELDPERDAERLNSWVNIFTQRLVDTQIPPRSSVLFTGESIQLADEEYLQGTKSLHWLTVEKGAMHFLGGYPVVGSKPFPLTYHSWLKASGEILVTPVSTAISPIDVVMFTKLAAEILKGLDDKQLIRDRELYETGRARDTSVLRGVLGRFKKILQPQDTDATPEYAGLPPLMAACRMVAAEMGINLSLEPSPAGQQEMDLTDIARQAGFRFREVVLEGNWWTNENGPLLASLDKEDRPIALLPQGTNGYLAVDPGTGTSMPMDQNLAKNILRTAYMFYRPFPDRQLRPRDVLEFAMFRSRRDLFMLISLGTLSGLLGLLTPIITGQLIGTFIPEASRSGIMQMAFILCGAALAMAAFNVLKGIAMVRMEGRIDLYVQAAVWDRLLSLPVPFFRKYTAGDLAVRSMGFAAMRQILSGVTLNTFLTLIFTSFNLLWLFYYDWAMALVAVALTALVGLITLGCGFFVVLYQKKVLEVQGRLSGMILQFITGINKLRLTGAEDRAFAVWAMEYAGQKEHSFKSGRVTAILTAFNGLFPVLAAVVLFGWYYGKMPDNMTVADFVAFNIAFTSFFAAFLQISAVIPSTALLIPLYQRARPILDGIPEFDEAKNKPGELTGDLSVNHLSFRYDPEGSLILKDVSMEARRGEFVAVVGGSGAGKSTILRLLLGFEVSEVGDVFYGDQELKNLDVREVRRQIGVVLQNGLLMAGDIFTNIVGAANLTMDDAWEAARMVGLAEEIEAMPMKMNTMVSTGGGTLSGGQRQRLLIARAIVRRPHILFFDEATSALDNKTQTVVSRSLDKLKVTRIVIAHRLSTIINADRIYVFDHGEVVEQGSYAELMLQKGYFYQLAKRQLV